MRINKVYKIILLFILLSFFLIIFLIRPILKNIEKNYKDLISAKNSIAILEVQTEEMDKFKKTYNNGQDFRKIDQLFVDQKNPVDLIKFLEDAASDLQIASQISLSSSSQNSRQASQNYLVLQIGGKGSFISLLNFLKQIETGPYLIEVESLNIQNSKKSEVIESAKGKTTGPAKINNAPDASGWVDATLNIKVFTKT